MTDPERRAVSRGTCDFGLTIVKGLVEKNDGTAYFGSLMGYADHQHQACLRGLITPWGEGWRPTEEGVRAYQERRLDRLPAAGRAYTWDWSVTEP